jgi:hypothetical protein
MLLTSIRLQGRLSKDVGCMQEELKITLEMKAKLEEKLHCFSEEAEHLKRKAEEYSNELHSLILKVALPPHNPSALCCISSISRLAHEGNVPLSACVAKSSMLVNCMCMGKRRSDLT